ncbi:uncharacterized protein LOC113204075 [Frankliniella occidentalis]|uniref:Uncharacterized protein LOC113204075 n=1 Tax=Frankliniella occidentalis TaxID=133901 RepID=A0A6J1S6L3_FRAOC|nr:uncharacterized protein LOC113204075 [Frankliniella occidentalis]
MTLLDALLPLLLLAEYRTSSPSFGTTAAATQYINNFAGPFRIVPDHAERCPAIKGHAAAASGAAALYRDIFWRGYHDRNNRDLWYYWGNVTTLRTLDESYDIDLNWASWSSRGGWKENAYVMRPGPVCQIIGHHDPDLWRRLMVATFNDPNRKCPFPPGYYEVKNVSAEFSLKQIPVFFYGTWRITVRLVDSAQDVAACVWLFGKTVPKS